MRWSKTFCERFFSSIVSFSVEGKRMPFLEANLAHGLMRDLPLREDLSRFPLKLFCGKVSGYLYLFLKTTPRLSPLRGSAGFPSSWSMWGLLKLRGGSFEKDFAVIARLDPFIILGTIVFVYILLLLHLVLPESPIISSFFSLSEARRHLPMSRARVSGARLASAFTKTAPPHDGSARSRRPAFPAWSCFSQHTLHA